MTITRILKFKDGNILFQVMRKTAYFNINLFSYWYVINLINKHRKLVENRHRQAKNE